MKSESLSLTLLLRVLGIADVMIEPRSVERRFWVISGCAGPSAARQVNLKKRTPELDRTDLKLRNLLAG